MHGLLSSLSELKQSLTSLKAKKMSSLPIKDQYESLVQLNSRLPTLEK